jgi:ribose transport system permease protein
MKRTRALRTLLSQYKLLAITAVLLVFMAFVRGEFFGVENLINIITNMSINGILSIGMTLLMIAGCFDISLGSILVLSGAVSIIALRIASVPVALLLGISSGVLMGILNGVLVAKFKINSFIATLGTMVIFQGATFSVTNNKPVATDSDAFQAFAMHNVAFGIPRLVFYFVIAILIIWVIARFTRLGKFAYAIGGNIEACRRVGIKVDLYLIGFFAISGLFGSFGGVALASKIQAASAIFGDNIGLLVIAAIVIGGVSLSGGVGKVGGVVQGIILIAIMDTMTNFLGLVGYYQLLFRSLLLLGVILYDVLSVRQAEQRLERLAVETLRRLERKEVG